MSLLFAGFFCSKAFLERPGEHLSGCYRRISGFGLLIGLFLLAGACRAQDTRTVTEPVFPAVCLTLTAQLSINGSGEPSSESTLDTYRIQSALTQCAGTKRSVELSATGTNNAFLVGPLTIPSNVILLVDGGVTVFASRDPIVWQNGSAATNDACGTLGTVGHGCRPMFTTTNTSGSGLMGYGVIDGRGQDKLILNGVTQSYSWYDNSQLTFTQNGIQNNIDMISAVQASNFQLYKITFRNSGHFNLRWAGAQATPAPAVTSGLTVWGAKIITPYNEPNTDGIDPVENVSNITIANSYISNGDDGIAISSELAGNPASNITISGLHTYAGSGISIGSATSGGVNNVLVTNIVQSGSNYTSFESGGFKIKSTADEGGVVNNVTFQNICQQNEAGAMRFYTVNGTPANTNYIPTFTNIKVSNVTVLANSNSMGNAIELEGYDASHLITLSLDNVIFTGNPNVKSYPVQYSTITVGPGPVSSAITGLKGTGITFAGSVTNPSEAPYPCTSASFQPLIGELYLSSGTAGSYPTGNSTNLQSLSVLASPSTAFTLNAMLQPGSIEYAKPTSPITFYEGAVAVGTAALSANGTLASLTLTGASVGTHTYTSLYPSDINYAAYSFGSVTVTVVAPIMVSASATAAVNPGSSVTSTITITPAGGFTGTVTLSCASPVSFVTCTVNPSVQISGTGAVTASAVIAVDTTVASGALRGAHRRSRSEEIALGAFEPFAGLLLVFAAWSKRGRPRSFLAGLLLAGCFGTTLGCGGARTADGPTTIHAPPGGTQTMTLTTAANGYFVNTPITVTIN